MSDSSRQSNHKRLLIKLLIGVLLMFGFAYLLVPLYNLVCKQVGINGRSATRDRVNQHLVVDKSRTVRMEFSSVVHKGLHFKFYPLQHHIDVHPGQVYRIYYYAENDTGHKVTVQAVPSIAPGEDAKYLKKTQCFCFTQQTFQKGEKVDMPVIFHVNPDIPKSVGFLVLNYTMFDASRFIKKHQRHFTRGRVEIH